MPLVGPKGQVVISKDIRDRLGIEAGWLALERVVEDHVEIYFVPPGHNRSLFACHAKYAAGAPDVPDEDVFHELTERAWERGVKETWDDQAR